MIDLSSFGQFLDEEDSQQARASALTAPSVSPDDMGKALAIGKKRNLPAAVVADHLPDYAEQDHLDGVTAASQQSPAAARWFQTPEHAALAQGESGKIGTLAATLSRTGDFIGDTIQNLLPFQFDQRQRLNRLGTHLQSGEAQPVGGAMQQVGEGAHSLLSTLYPKSPMARAVMAQVLPLGDPDAREAQAKALAAKGADIADFGRALSASASQGVQRPASVGEALTHPGNTFDYFGGIGAESLPMMLASAPFGASAGPAVGGLATQAQSYGQYRSEGVAPGAAFGAASLQGLLETLGEIIPFHEAFKPGGSFARRLARTQVAETGSEMATQAAQDEAESETLGRPITPQQRIANVIDAGLSAFGLSLPMSVAGHAHDARARSNAVDTLGTLASSVDGARRVSAVVEQVGDMKLGTRAPDALHALAKEAAPDAHVYISAEQARTLFQSDRAGADQFVGDLTGNPDALREAEATGGDVVIPMADFVARVATLPNAADIAQHARLHPEHLSRAELDNEDALNEHLAAIFGDADATQADPTSATTDSSEQVTQDVLGMLLASDRYTPADAELQAKLVGRVFGRIAERSGQDAKALYDRYQLRINGHGKQGKPNLLDPRTDALLTAARTGQLPSAADAYGPSLVTSLVAMGGLQDSGGELRGMDAHKEHPGVKAMFGREAKPGLVNPFGMTLDEAREWAVEAGYLRDPGAESGGTTESGVNDLLDAIDAELRGAPVHSEQHTDPKLAAFREQAQGLAQAIEDTFHGSDPAAYAALSNQEVHDKLFPPERSLLQKAGDTVRNLFQRKPARALDFGDRSDAQLDAEYDALPGSEGGRRLDTDLVRELSPEYRADRTRAAQVHQAASAWTKARFLRMLAQPVAAGRDNAVLFTAGGGGSGKSTAVKDVLGDSNADIIYDGTLSSMARARKEVQAALASGRDVRIAYVYRSPENAAAGAIGRAIRTRRPVPVAVLAEAHANAEKVVKALAQEYADDARVEIIAINNDGEAGKAERMPIGAVPEVNHNAAEAAFRSALEAARGTLDETLYAAFDGRTADAEVGAAAHRQSQSQRQGESRHAVTQDPAAGGVSAFGQPDGAGAPRGQLRIGANRSMSIDLLKGADLSTFLHETGHFFLEVMSDAAEQSADVKADLDAVRAWTGNTGEAFTEDQHEQFARGWEAYLREGKAPAPELRSMFARFRAWLTSVYRDLRQLHVTLTPEVAGVFDRMLATDDEIEAAQVRQGMQPLTLSPESRALLSDAQWATYVAALRDATEEARSDVLQKLLAAHKREAQAWWKEQQAKTRSEVEGEFEAAPAVRAWRILSGRTTVDGAEVPEHLRGLRLDRAALVAMTSEQWVKDKLHRLGVYRKEGGVHPDTAALALGFDSGDGLVKSLAEVRDLQARIGAETDRRMHERHPDPLTDGSLPERAMDAVHGVKRVAALEQEMALVATLAKQPAPPARLVREYARRKIAGLTLRGIRPNEYLAAERRGAREAAKAAAQGDYAEALQRKRAQALNVALYAEARSAQDRAESQIAALKKLASDKSRERIGKAGKSYLDALDAVLEGHELRQASGAEVRRRDALRAWAETQQDEGGDTILSQDLLDRIEAERVTNVRDLTVQQLTDLHETATNIAHLARLKNTLLRGKEQRDWADAKDDLVTGLRAVLDAGKPPPLSSADLSLLERAGQGYGQFMDWMLRPETIVEWLDGGESGPWHDYFWAPMEAGEQARNALRRAIAEPLTKLLTDLPKAERAALDGVVSVPALGRSVSRNTILSVLLNLGTASSRDKLLRGGMMIDGEVLPFHPEQVAAMLAHLSPAQANLAQQVWDALDTLWPHIQAQQEALSGFAPDKLEATPVTFTASDGTQVSLRGGYYPAAYDPRAGHVGNQQQDSEKLLGSDFTRATTAKGYTKERTQYAAPMLLDYHAVLSRHLNQVITDLAYRQPLRQMLRVLADPTLKGIIGQRLSPSAWSVLDGSVKATIRGTSGMQEPASAFFEKVKAGVIRNTVVAALGLKVGLLVANTVTAPLLATARVKTRFIVDGLAQYYRHPAKMTALVHELSPFMADRATHTGQGYDDILAELRGKHGIRHRIAEASLAMHHWINPLVERGIWLGRYLQAQHEGAGIAESVRLADKSIRQTQTQAAPKDLSAVERDPRYKVFNLFIGPMVIANNRLQDAGLRGKLHGAVATPAVALGTWFAMTVANGALFDLLSGRTPDDRDDDGLDWADWSTWLARKAALFPFQTMPFIRNAANLFDGSKSARPDPLTEAMALMVKFGKSVDAHALDAWGGDPDAQGQLAKDTARAAGVAVGLPSTQAVTTGGNLYDAATGAAPITSPLDARYLVYRR